MRGGLFTLPLPVDAAMRLRARVNNYPLANPRIESGWFVFDLDPSMLAPGENLIGVSFADDFADGFASLQKVEVHALFLEGCT